MDDLSSHLRLARDARSTIGRAALDAAVRGGDLTRVCTGAYVRSAFWGQATDRERHLLIAHAARLLRRRRLVFSHWTAAATWNIPILGSLPDDAHVVADRTSGGRTDERLVRHCVGIPASTSTVAGLDVTMPARTVMDVARVAPFEVGVAAADAALRDRLVTLEELERELGPAGRRGFARASRVLEFADPLSGSVGESLSRVTIAAAGFPAPILQHCFEDRHGRMYADFWWPQFNRVGEFDGAVKYDDPSYLAGRTPQQALLDEKSREDRIRALGPGVIRWRWDVARSPGAMRAHLLAGGIQLERYRKW